MKFKIISSIVLIALIIHPVNYYFMIAPVQAQEPDQTELIDISKSTEVDEENEFDNLKNSLLINSSINSLTETQQNKIITTQKVQAKVHNLAKKTYKAIEKIPVVIENEDPTKVKIEVFDSDGVQINVEIENASISSTAILRVAPPPRFKPGKYHMKITDSEGNVTTQDFTWGVLAINTNKAVYAPDETAKIHIGVLDETGNMVCDAKVKLTITDPSGNKTDHTTDSSSIKVNPQCYLKVFSLEPDFEARYTVGDVGKYEMLLTATTENGTYSINDAFDVMEDVPFDIERTSATRIFPPLQYPMTMTVKANQDFEGEIKEIIPDNFYVENIEGLLPFDAVATHSSTLTDNNTQTVALSKPFSGNFRTTQGFGVDETDESMAAKYIRYGLLGHDGIDFAVPSGTDILAVDDGYIARAAENSDYGTTIIIQHSWGKSYYGHLSIMNKALGDTVSRAEKIASSGNTGLLTTGPHLHFGIKFEGNNPSNGYYGKVNPLPYLNNSLEAVAGVATPSATLINEDSQGVQVLTWKVNVKKGDTLNIGYKYLSPKKSPQFYTVGPLSFTANGNEGFPDYVEQRRWQIAVDADGSGTMSVTPTTGTPSQTQQTYTFTFDPSETMDSGGITIQEPTADDWTVPQGTNGVAGYTTASVTGSSTIGTVLNSADVITGWAEQGGTDACQTANIAIDTTTKQEGAASITCNNNSATQPDDGDGIGYNFTSQNWSTLGYTEISFWARSDDGMTTAEIDFVTDDDTNCVSGQLQNSDFSADLTADTWVYQKITLSGTLTDVEGVCFLQVLNSADQDQYWIDDVLVGPGLPSFSGSSPWITTVRFIDLSASDNVTVTYGAGGGASGVTNSTSSTIHSFTTSSKPTVTGTYTALSAGSPTVTLSTGPTNDLLLRHGKWFSVTGGEQPFAF